MQDFGLISRFWLILAWETDVSPANRARLGARLIPLFTDLEHLDTVLMIIARMDSITLLAD